MQRGLTECRRDGGALDLLERVRERAALEHERRVLRGRGGRLRDLRVAGDALGELVVGVVDVRRLDEPAVENDGVVTGVRRDRVLIGRVELASLAGVHAAAVELLLGDVLELFRAVTRELQRPRSASRCCWSTSAAIPDSTRSFPVSAGGSLNRYQYLPLDEVPFWPAPGQPFVRVASAVDRLQTRRHLQDRGVLGLLPVLVRQQQLLQVRGRALHDLVEGLCLRNLLALDLRRDRLMDRLGEVIELRLALARLLHHGRVGEQLVERAERRRLVVPLHGRRHQARLEVEHLERAGRADHLRRLRRVMDAGELHDDLVPALDRHVRRGDADRVHPVGDDLLRDLHLRRVDRLALLRNRPQNDLDPALEIEAERRLLVDRRARNREQQRADEGGGDRPHEQKVVAALSHEGAFKIAERLAVVLLVRCLLTSIGPVGSTACPELSSAPVSRSGSSDSGSSGSGSVVTPAIARRATRTSSSVRSRP